MSSSTKFNLATAKTVLSAVGSIAATAMVVRTVANDFLPYELQDYFYSSLQNFFNRFSSQLTIVIDEFDGLITNEIYSAAEIYLASKISPNTRRLRASKSDKEKNINVTMERNEEVIEIFDGAKFNWVLLCRQVESGRTRYNSRDMSSSLRSEIRSFQLTFHKKHKKLVLESYFPFILKEANSIKHEKKTIKIYTVDYENMYNLNDAWTGVNLDHPATFDTLAMDSEQKETIFNDLDQFVRRRDYYRKVGKAWKRGYLLYGPPGTGKSSLIAAMANYLNYDVYDLELTELRCNSELRRLLVATANRSILVVEDIDCTIDLQDRAEQASVAHGMHQPEKVTLSGLLNFVDGLWSSCGDERIIIFTTNHKEKLDSALLRPGRMDVHIHMHYCTPSGFKLLASNYLGIKDHKLFGEIEELIKLTEVTPAEVAEQLLKSDEPDLTLRCLIGFLHEKNKENVKAKAEPKKVVEELKLVAKEGDQGEATEGKEREK